MSRINIYEIIEFKFDGRIFSNSPNSHYVDKDGNKYIITFGWDEYANCCGGEPSGKIYFHRKPIGQYPRIEIESGRDLAKSEIDFLKQLKEVKNE